MQSKLYFNYPIFTGLLLLIIVLLNELYLKETQNKPEQQMQPIQQSDEINKNKLNEIIVTSLPTDLIRDYDYRKINDPLENPARRVPRHAIPPYYLKQFIDIPTRGYPDNYHLLGILIRNDGESEGPSENKILRLFGRETYPGSNMYEYYTSIASGLDHIKLPIDTPRTKEFNDNDSVTVLNKTYNVQLHPCDAPKYYPDIL